LTVIATIATARADDHTSVVRKYESLYGRSRGSENEKEFEVKQLEWSLLKAGEGVEVF
jgi:hypothetical protein